MSADDKPSNPKLPLCPKCEQEAHADRLGAALRKIAAQESKHGTMTIREAANIAHAALEAAPADETCTCGNGSIPGPAHHPTCSAYFEPARPDETTAEQR